MGCELRSDERRGSVLAQRSERECAMKQTVDVDLRSTRLAFWGYTNSRGVDAALNLARQLRRCEHALNDRAEISRFFYETPQPVSDIMALAVRSAGGPCQCDGGWDDLAAVLPTAERGFDAIICASVDRVGRISNRLLEREPIAAECGVATLTADELMLDSSEPGGQLWRSVVTSVHDLDHSSAVSHIRRTRWCDGG